MRKTGSGLHQIIRFICFLALFIRALKYRMTRDALLGYRPIICQLWDL